MSLPRPAGQQVPAPPHPKQRREPLPTQRLKAPEDDPDAPRRVQLLLDSPSYREADQDVEFLHEESARGTRLQLDYLKAETRLREHDIGHTVVVFGSTRIVEPSAARRAAESSAHALAADPENSALALRLRRAERILAKSHYYDVAREFGRLVSAAGRAHEGSRIVILTGGGPGIMEAANRGAFEVGAKSVGLNIHLPHEQFPNPYITPELCFRFHYFALRKLHFLLRTRALVAFPGGYGTLDELFETLTLVQTRTIKPVPIVLVGQQYWRKIFDVDFLVQEGLIEPEDRELFWFAETAQETWDGILRWHEANGQPLL
jgi:uncharacterized protein (TIGR00730 family)